MQTPRNGESNLNIDAVRLQPLQPLQRLRTSEGYNGYDGYDGYKGYNGCNGYEGYKGYNRSDASPEAIHVKDPDVLLFRLAIKLKSDASLSETALREAVAAWFGKLDQSIKDNFDGLEDVLERFWKKYARSRGDPCEAAWLSSEDSEPPPCAESCHSPKLKRLVTWLRDIQVLVGEGKTWYLSSYIVGQKLGMTQSNAWDWMKRLQDKNVIVKESSGNRAKSNIYRFIAELYLDGGQPF